MINLYKNKTNTIIVTLSENLITATTGYTLKLISQFDNNIYSFDIENISEARNRYDKFNIDISNSDIKVGIYNYEIFESNNPTIIESGLCKVHDNKDIVYTISQNKQYTQYER